jgi:hypothetical protein
MQILPQTGGRLRRCGCKINVPQPGINPPQITR